jgi:hypothetical protein
MPRWYRRRRTTRRRTRRDSALPLFALLVLAVLLLIVVNNDEWNLSLPQVDLPPLPDINIPITGLPDIRLPTMKIPITVVPGTLIPGIGIGGTPVPEGAPPLSQRTKDSGCALRGSLPDPECTPGAVLSTQASEVCDAAFASSVGDAPQNLREEVYADYGLNSGASSSYPIDQLIPASLGGSNDIANLWPSPLSPAPGFNEKAEAAVWLRQQVCSGNVSLQEAQRQMAADWTTVYNRMPR